MPGTPGPAAVTLEGKANRSHAPPRCPSRWNGVTRIESTSPSPSRSLQFPDLSGIQAPNAVSGAAKHIITIIFGVTSEVCTVYVGEVGRVLGPCRLGCSARRLVGWACALCTVHPRGCAGTRLFTPVAPTSPSPGQVPPRPLGSRDVLHFELHFQDTVGEVVGHRGRRPP